MLCQPTNAQFPGIVRDVIVPTTVVPVEGTGQRREDAWSGAGHKALHFGSKSIKGARAQLEDVVQVHEVRHSKRAILASCVDANPLARSSRRSTEEQPGYGDASDILTYFAVFDGHGGIEAAQHSAARLHQHFEAQLQTLQHERSCSWRSGFSSAASECTTFGASPHMHALSAAGESPSSSSQADDGDVQGMSVDVAAVSPSSSEELPSPPGVLSTPLPSPSGRQWPQGSLEDRYAAAVCHSLKQAFLRTDAELAGTEVGELVGSTAVVAVVSPCEVYVAHAGDSRAVLSRKGTAVALTEDHKPNRKDEASRILAAGGKVLYKGGSHRVMGLLAMSRAIGDHFLRPFVIPDPEVTCLQRSDDDDLILLATDGLWDVFTNQEAVNLALRSLQRARERGASRMAACRVGANVLTKAALDRGSRDNVSVVIIDLRRPENPSKAAVLASQCSDDSNAAGPVSPRSAANHGGATLDGAGPAPLAHHTSLGLHSSQLVGRGLGMRRAVSSQGPRLLGGMGAAGAGPSMAHGGNGTVAGGQVTPRSRWHSFSSVELGRLVRQTVSTGGGSSAGDAGPFGVQAGQAPLEWETRLSPAPMGRPTTAPSSSSSPASGSMQSSPGGNLTLRLGGVLGSGFPSGWQTATGSSGRPPLPIPSAAASTPLGASPQSPPLKLMRS